MNPGMIMPMLMPEMLKPYGTPPVKPLPLNICAVCFVPANPWEIMYHCTGCMLVSYCSEFHQLEHWGEHQEECRAFTMLQLEKPDMSSTLEPKVSYHACNELEAETVVLNLSPIMMGPSQFEKPKLLDMQLCLSCSGWFRVMNHYLPCPGCSWPMCSLECASNPIHAGNECWVLQSEGVKPQLEDIYLSGILALRCLLLKRTSPSDFDSLMEFYDECRGRNRSSDALDEDKTLVEFLLEKCKIPKLLADPSINKEFLHTFLKIVELCTVKMGESSAHEFVTQEGKTFKRFVSAMYVFPQKMKITRHCSPNMRWTLTYSPHLEYNVITFRTTMAVSIGEALTAAWGNEIELGTFARQSVLTARFTEPCLCSRCRDESEFKTDFNTVRCFSCRKVSLRPMEPTNPKSSWQCIVVRCRQEFPPSRVLPEIFTVYRNIERLNGAEQSNLLKYIHDMSRETKLLHPCHYLIIRGASYFIQHFSSKIAAAVKSDGLDIKSLNSFLDLVDRSLFVYTKLIPGDSEIRGRLLYQKQAALSFKRLRDVEWFLTLRNPNKDFEINRNIEPIRLIQKEALNCLKYCQRGTVGHEHSLQLKGVLLEIWTMLLFRCRTEQPLDRRIALQLYNMYARMTNLRQIVIPKLIDLDLDISKFVF